MFNIKNNETLGIYNKAYQDGVFDGIETERKRIISMLRDFENNGLYYATEIIDLIERDF